MFSNRATSNPTRRGENKTATVNASAYDAGVKVLPIANANKCQIHTRVRCHGMGYRFGNAKMPNAKFQAGPESRVGCWLLLLERELELGIQKIQHLFKQ